MSVKRVTPTEVRKDPSEVTNIAEAINAVMFSVAYIQKQKADGLRYTFAGEAALIRALRPFMVDYGVVVYVEGYDVLHEESYSSASGSKMNRMEVRATVVFEHAPSKTHISVQALGEGADSGDKALNKAMTGAYKYALRQTFMIETGDDPDITPSEKLESATPDSQLALIMKKAAQLGVAEKVVEYYKKIGIRKLDLINPGVFEKAMEELETLKGIVERGEKI